MWMSQSVVLFWCFMFLTSNHSLSSDIEARPDMESDKKLDKLETFLGRLNSKGKGISC